MTLKMTTPQREALLKLIAYQNQAGREIAFWCHSVTSASEEVQICPYGKNGEVIAEMLPEYAFLWQQLGLVTLGDRGGPTFILRQEAFDWAEAQAG